MSSLLLCMPCTIHSRSFVKTSSEMCVLVPLFDARLKRLILTPQGERNYIMQVVCEATQNPSVQVQATAFECLVRIMSLYYSKMGYYMERALFGVLFFFTINVPQLIMSHS